MFQDVPIKSLIPSPFNYRRHADEAALAELTASVKSKGVLQPILVRPLSGKQKGKYEIVAGHRRHQAASSAGLKLMPAMVKDLTDEEALEVQVIENTQREDPNPMDEALGFKRLLEMGKHTPETLAARIDRSVKYVLERVKLADLDKKVQDAIASGDLPLGIARLFTRLRNEGDQKKFLKDVTEDGGASVRRAERMIQEYTQSLGAAPFDTEACAACPCNSGNQTALFPEIGKDDQCSDKTCYYTKSKKRYTDILNEKKKAGCKVYTKDDEVRNLTGYGAKNSCEIASTKKEAGYYIEHPKKYKTECAACTENHAYYLVERQGYNGKRLEYGEICLDKKCLAAMQREGEKEEKRAASGGETAENRANPHTLRIKARDCRDRFLLKALLPKVGTSLALKQRLAIHHIISHLSRTDGSWRDAFIKEYNPQYKGAGLYFSGDKVYRGIAGIPAEKLDGALLHLVHETFSMTDRDVMLQMTPEAGIDMVSDFEMDEEYLKGKTKDELAALIKEQWTKEEKPLEWAVDMDKWCATAPKGKIIEKILGTNLVGKVPAIVAEVCRLDIKDDDDGDDADQPVGDWCGECGEEGEDCTCDGGADLSGDSEGEEPDEAPDDDPTMPVPTKTKTKKRKPRARA